MKQRIKNYLLSHFVKVLIPQDVIRDVKGVLYLGKEKVTDQELKVLQAEAKALKSMRLWSILNETVRQKVFDRGWKESTTMEHLNTAKTMYSVLEFQESVVNIIKNKNVV
jgi:hypothetical protein